MYMYMYDSTNTIGATFKCTLVFKCILIFKRTHTVATIVIGTLFTVGVIKFILVNKCTSVLSAYA